MPIFLREIQRSDLPEINRWRNNKSLVDCLGSPFRYINGETEEQWFQSYSSSRANNVRLAVCQSADHKLLGVIYLLHIDWLNRNCEYAIQIGESSLHGKGIGYQATRMILEHAFSDLNLHRVYLTVLETNERAIRLYHRIGFSEEGRHLRAIFKNGQYLNLIQMSIFADGFHAPLMEDPALCP